MFSYGTFGLDDLEFIVFLIEGPFLVAAFDLSVGLTDLLSSPCLISLNMSC